MCRAIDSMKITIVYYNCASEANHGFGWHGRRRYLMTSIPDLVPGARISPRNISVMFGFAELATKYPPHAAGK